MLTHGSSSKSSHAEAGVFNFETAAVNESTHARDDWEDQRRQFELLITSLFRKVLERYAGGPSAYFRAALKETTARQAIERFLTAAIEQWTASDNPPGCLIIRASVSVDSSESIRREIEARQQAAEVLLRERIERGVITVYRAASPELLTVPAFPPRPGFYTN